MRSTRMLFGGTVLLASTLLFLVEPIAAKQLLPALGGSAAVWLTCLVFFQVTLLAGYAYAHSVAQSSRQVLPMHLLLLAAGTGVAVLWAGAAHGPGPTSASPFSTIFVRLSVSIGLPFFLLSATGPLLQVWLARQESGRVRYRLYALSNLGSLGALLLYPSVVEPLLSLRVQRIVWCAGFILFAAMSAVIALSHRDRRSSEKAVSAGMPRTRIGTRLLWFLLPLGAAVQLSAVTAHLSANVAAIPLLWIPPLAVYMLTLIVAFQFPGLQRQQGLVLRFLAVMLASLGYMLSRAEVSLPISLTIAFFLLELLAACLFCHVEVCRLRPANASEATLFYLLLAAGGAAGSFLVGIASPLLCSSNYDLAISFLTIALLALAVTWLGGWAPRLLWMTGSALLVFVLWLLQAAYARDTLLAVRNFYGSLRVKQSLGPGQQPMRTLVNGSIQHGTQIFSPELRTAPTTYYATDSGVGLAIADCCGGHSRHLGVIGLGAGTLAAYGRAGDRIRFYEINPAVLPIAQSLFTYLRDSRADLSFSIGDARTSLASEPPQNFDVLAIDAFSGDAIPLHLLTTGALTVYRRQIMPCGTLAFHVSNQYVDLVPELAALAQATGMEARSVSSAGDVTRGEFRATWVLLTSSSGTCPQRPLGVLVQPVRNGHTIEPWTDDYSSLLPLIRW